jgi:hypothetical protein
LLTRDIADLMVQRKRVDTLQVSYIDNIPRFHGNISGKPIGKLTLAPGERLSAIFGTSGNNLNSIGFDTEQGLQYGPWGNFQQGSPYRFLGTLTGFFGAINTQGLVALGVWAIDATVVMPPPPPPPPPPPDPVAGGFDGIEPCPLTDLPGSGISFRLMENQVRMELLCSCNDEYFAQQNACCLSLASCAGNCM